MNTRFVRWGRNAFAMVIATVLGACGTVPMGSPQASIDNIQLARSAGISSAAVGRFSVAPGKDPAIDSSVGIRATTLQAPGGSFAGYLKDTLAAELAGAGLLDAASTIQIEGFLIDRQVDPAMSKGTAQLAARFIVRRKGTVTYDRELSVSSTWESSFVGAVAIPAAINEFTSLFRKLVTNLLSDPAFVSAMKS